jgi:hypothetical protein
VQQHEQIPQIHNRPKTASVGANERMIYAWINYLSVSGEIARAATVLPCYGALAKKYNDKIVNKAPRGGNSLTQPTF